MERQTIVRQSLPKKSKLDLVEVLPSKQLGFPSRKLGTTETIKEIVSSGKPHARVEDVIITQKPKTIARVVDSSRRSQSTRAVQKSISSRTKKIDPAVANIIRRIANIDQSDPVQISSGYNIEKTVPSAPYASQTAGFGTSGYLPVSDTVGFSFRSLCRANIFYQAAFGAYTYMAYACSSTAPGSPGYEVPSPGPVYTIPSQNSQVPIDIKYAMATTTDQPHGPILFAGSDGNSTDRYIWLDNGLHFNAAAIWGAGTNSVVCKITVYKFNIDKGYLLQEIVATTSAGGAVAFSGTLADAGYMRFTITQTSAATENTFTFSNISWSSDAGDSVMQHLPAPGYAENYLTATAFKQYGCNMMLSNEASLNSMQGKIACLQVSPGRMWTDFVAPTGGYDIVAASNGYKWFKAMDGAYSYLKPTSPKDFEFVSELKIINSVLMDSSFDIVPKSGFLVQYAVVTNTDGQDFIWSRWQSLEIISTNMWFTLTEGKDLESEFQQAMEIMKRMPQHFENPLHLGAIISAIAAGARGVNTVIEMASKYGSPLLKTIGGMG